MNGSRYLALLRSNTDVRLPNWSRIWFPC